MTNRINIAQIQVAECLYDFVEKEVMPNLGLNKQDFWQGFSDIINQFSVVNEELLETRQSLQHQIDQWHNQHQGDLFNFADYKAFLTEIGYLEPKVDDFKISTVNVDAELASMAGPQLVVPIMNARFALNAVNARWGSLYDALYGTDAISSDNGAEKSNQYNPIRGQKVIEFARDFLDQAIPLASGKHEQVKRYQILDNSLVATLINGDKQQLDDPKQCLGYTGTVEQPDSIIFKHNELHLEICFDANNPIANSDIAGVSDVLLESALTTIMDCEDSVAAVDASDKVIAYRNWLGLNLGTLSEKIQKGSKTFTRTMANDKTYHDLLGNTNSLSGRSLMFVRNVGHLMTNNAVLTQQGQSAPEGIIDAVITSLIALHDIKGLGSKTNSKAGSIYIVKPKMHGSAEVAFANLLFSKVEALLKLPANTIKMGIMDEERRTSVNLKNCIYAAKERVVFINTGFLDRTGDEIHTSMNAGVMAKKADIKLTPWISAYEDNNVDIGLACGFSGKAQIGKGMWPIPDQMSNMLANKINHVLAGANTAWVPSPTAATLHAIHYHQTHVLSLQQQLSKRSPANVDDILTIPLAENTNWSTEEINNELDNNAQGILGYVVRWIDQGIGCSKVPDINNVGLMEDRATLRISSQHIANWLKHGICTKSQVLASMKKMASIVDEQNKGDNQYQPMATNFDTNIAFKAACDLVFKGTEQPSGYTEPLLHQYRLNYKDSH
ncbi:malate synthase G [Thalassotalea profundi]|uniref:Malate synthase G n=1 Tax=Thalassotalea profundi TaxID=2036687 RepID=A0ABQ3IHB3_9GAMM|nr:malate synthase G [Thalassotalea profundi]GHE81229.1 malate synthase G [Thalassotalea profundi]